MKRIISTLLCGIMAMGLMAGPPRYGGSFSSSRSFSSRPSYSSPSRPSTERSGGSFSTPSAPRMITRPTQSSMARVQQQNAMASQAKASLSKFKAPSTPSPAVASIKSSPVFSKRFTPSAPKTTYRSYLSNRQTYYSSYHPPVYVYNYSSSYGMWDAMFMWMMLDNMNHMMYYNHRYDPDYQRWRADADKQAQTDADLRAKLATLDAKVKELEKAKTPVDPSYMPPGVDPTVALSVNAAEATLPQETVQNETVAEEPNGWDDDSEAGIVALWVMGILIGTGLTIWGIASWLNRRNARDSFSSRYRL